MWDKTQELMLAFVSGRKDVAGMKVRDWMSRLDVGNKIADTLASYTTVATPFLESLMAKLAASDAGIEAEDIRTWRSSAMVGPDDCDELANIVYVGLAIGPDTPDSGIRTLNGVYVGKTRWATVRGVQPMPAMAKWTIAGAESAPLHYQTAVRSDEVLYVPAIVLGSAVAKDEADVLLAIWEWALCWALGTYQQMQSLIEARAEYGLTSPGYTGMNSTSCVEGPHAGGSQRLTPGVIDEQYLRLRGRFRLALGMQIMYKFKGLEAAPWKDAKARAREAMRCRMKQMLDTGALKVMWQRGSKNWFLLGYCMRSKHRKHLTSLYDGVQDMVFCVTMKAQEPHPQFDLAYACPEARRPRYAGIVLEVNRPGSTKPPMPVQNMRLNLGAGFRSLIERLFSTLPEVEQSRRRAAEAAKEVEIQGRNTGYPASLSPVAQSALKGELSIAAFVHLYIDGARIQLDKQQDAKVAKKWAIFCGFEGPTFSMHEHPQMQARIVCGGEGLWDFTSPAARRVPHIEAEEGFELQVLNFGGVWKTWPKKLVPIQYGDPANQLERSQGQRVFLNAGRELLGLPPRPILQLPPGVEERQNFAFRSNSDKDRGQIDRLLD
ncbi:unnamed protein product [Parajaminaea phylloscopi]